MPSFAVPDLPSELGLPEAWRHQPIWRLLDTRFGDGLRFLNTWRAWQVDPHRPAMLHGVALTSKAVAAAELQLAVADKPALQPLAKELARQWLGLTPGFHRLVLEEGRVVLTLCIGPLQSMLRELQFLADSICLVTPESPDLVVSDWDVWTMKALARCCRRHTLLATTTALTPAMAVQLAQCGFEMAPSNRLGRFNPRWQIKHTRSPWARLNETPRSCIVVGAGLAGASAAAALARRGWQVQVLDAAPLPAMGASGLPVGLVVPHSSADDGPRSRLSRAGVRLTLQQARQLLREGLDWRSSGVLELRKSGSPGLPSDWPEAGLDWSRPASAALTDAPWHHGVLSDAPAWWHTLAAWIKPARLVQAWLAQPGVRFTGLAQADSIRRLGGEWAVFDPEQRLLGSASHIVLATAHSTPRLLKSLQSSAQAPDLDLARLPALQGIRGLVSWGLQSSTDTAPWPPFPVNGMGSFICNVPTDDGPAWFLGASYEPDDCNPAPPTAHHQANQARLQGLLPAVGAVLQDRFEAGHIRGWGQTRCASADRLPLVGPLTTGDSPSLWISTGMGSRGLSYSVLCAELLAARLNAEPLPIEASLARFLHSLRAK